MAKTLSVSELYERTTPNGERQTRKFNSVYLSKSRIARQMIAQEGWQKVVGSAVGVPTPAKPKGKAKPVETEEQPELNVSEE